jgi:hypothetical protein
MKPVSQITDRAKRYRAQRNRPAGPKRCGFCASRENIDVDHIEGDEDDGEPENLMYLCRPCNTAKGITQARNRIGRRTAQYNPGKPRLHTADTLNQMISKLHTKAFKAFPSSPVQKEIQAEIARLEEMRRKLKAEKNPTFAQYVNAAQVLTGRSAGDARAATATIRATPAAKRQAYTDRIERANPFRSEAQRRKFYAMLQRGEITAATMRKMQADNPAPPPPTFAQYAFGVSIHTRGAHDEGGKIIHATPPAKRHQYAQEIARRKAERYSVPF